jgi:hypothetical protein
MRGCVVFGGNVFCFWRSSTCYHRMQTKRSLNSSTVLIILFMWVPIVYCLPNIHSCKVNHRVFTNTNTNSNCNLFHRVSDMVDISRPQMVSRSLCCNAQIRSRSRSFPSMFRRKCRCSGNALVLHLVGAVSDCRSGHRLLWLRISSEHPRTYGNNTLNWITTASFQILSNPLFSVIQLWAVMWAELLTASNLQTERMRPSLGYYWGVAAPVQDCNFSIKNEHLVMSPGWGSTPRQTDWLTNWLYSSWGRPMASGVCKWNVGLGKCWGQVP